MEVNRFECQTVPASCLARRDIFIGLPILRLDVAWSPVATSEPGPPQAVPPRSFSSPLQPRTGALLQDNTDNRKR